MEKTKKLNKLIIKYAIWMVILFILFLVTFLCANRINVFANVFGSISTTLHGVALTAYFVALYASITITVIMLFIVIVIKLFKLDWIEPITKCDKIIDIPYFIFKVLALFLFMMINVITPCTVVGDSMLPTFETGEKVLCVNNFFEEKRGDIVVIDAYNYTGKNSFYIKRVVAAGGDVFTYFNGKVYVNGIEEYLIDYDDFLQIAEDLDILADKDTKIKIPHGKLYVVGDNREDSYDSRIFGLVDRKDVFGKVFLRILPINKFSFF